MSEKRNRIILIKKLEESRANVTINILQNITKDKNGAVQMKWEWNVDQSNEKTEHF